MTYVKASIPKIPGGGAAVAKKDKIYIIDVDDVATDVTREFGNTSTSSNLALNEGAKAVAIQVSRSSISVGYENSGDVDAKVFADKVEFDYPGDSVALNNFVEAYANKGVIIIVQSCDAPTKIYGRTCNPLVLSAEPTDSKDGLKTHLSFTQEMGDAYVPRVYTGTLPAVAEDAEDESAGE
ncbi:MAG: hypothetical protein II891_06845 [Bacteroidales bacterium]|nr:hypothetical protein [Bacteroidales bacterium]